MGHIFRLLRQAFVLAVDCSLHECTLACSFIESTWGFRAQRTPSDAHTSVGCVPLTPGPLDVVRPAVSFFERAGNAYFNSLVVADADGSIVGHYRKSHIPDGPGYQEKFYFSPGDTGFKVFDTRFGRVGALICWDQWFPEGARCLALMGAELIFYPTAIGSEPPPAPPVSSYLHWQRVMAGHAGASMVPVIAANRLGREEFEKSHITFYGGSFITDETGRVVAQVAGGLAGRGVSVSGALMAVICNGRWRVVGDTCGPLTGPLLFTSLPPLPQVGGKVPTPNGGPDADPEQVEGFVTASFDLDEIRTARARYSWGSALASVLPRTGHESHRSPTIPQCHARSLRSSLKDTHPRLLPRHSSLCSWGLFRDRRPELYGAIRTLDGVSAHR